MIRRERWLVRVRVYRAANGATVGSIIAVIINAHTDANAANDRPIVPGIAPIPRATAAMPTHAPAATIKSIDAGRVSCLSVGVPAAPVTLTPSGHPVHAKG